MIKGQVNLCLFVLRQEVILLENDESKITPTDGCKLSLRVFRSKGKGNRLWSVGTSGKSAVFPNVFVPDRIMEANLGGTLWCESVPEETES